MITYTKYEVIVMMQKQVLKTLKRKKKCTEELRPFEKISVSDSDQESINSSSREGDKI